MPDPDPAAQVDFAPHGGEALATVGPEGQVPQTRMADAMACQNRVARLMNDDRARSRVRGAVDGLVDGNPPFSPAQQRALGRAEDCNANWGTGTAMWSNASGALYDLVSQAPGHVTFETEYGKGEQRLEWGRIMVEEAERTIQRERSWNTRIQLSQKSTVLHGKGPFFFDTWGRVFPKSIAPGNLLLHDRAPVDPEDWDFAVVLQEYYPPQLFEYIRNREASERAGWNPDYTLNVIRNAVDKNVPSQYKNDMEWVQNMLKTKAYESYQDDLCCRSAHCFWREFPESGARGEGRVTHAIVESQTSATKGVEYLYFSLGRYERFQDVIHPMYYDVGRDDLFHTVTGLGTKQYSAVEYENRVRCQQFNRIMAPDLMFRSTTADSKNQFQITPLGPYGIVGPGWELQQTPTRGIIVDALAVMREAGDTMRSNLSEYRQQVQPEKSGNPDTATEARMKASMAGALSATVYSRQYDNLDSLYETMIGRMFDPNSPDWRAQECQRRCAARRVPAEAMGSIVNIRAVRVVGQGSPWLRQQAISAVAPVIRQCSERGQANWRHDFIAANAGPSAIERWDPQPKEGSLPDAQQERAVSQLAVMKAGMPAVVADSQDAVVFATTFLKAASDALGSLSQGGDPHEVARFCDLAGKAAAQHLRRMAGDPLRADAVAALQGQLKQIGGMLDKLKGVLAKQAQQQQKLQQKGQAVQSEMQIKAAKEAAGVMMRKAKQDANLSMAMQRHKQQMAIADSTAASQIQLNHFRALHES